MPSKTPDKNSTNGKVLKRRIQRYRILDTFETSPSHQSPSKTNFYGVTPSGRPSSKIKHENDLLPRQIWYRWKAYRL